MRCDKSCRTRQRTPSLGSLVQDSAYHNRYCGPGALSIITGHSTQCTAHTAREVSGRLMITGLAEIDIRDALFKYGYMSNRERLEKGITLARWLRERSPEQRKNLYLIRCGHHYVVVKGNKLCDNWTEDPVFIRKAPHRRKRMQSVYRVFVY